MRELRLALAALPLVFACSAADPTPQHVTGLFWEAVRVGDVEAARDLASAASAPLVDELRLERRIDDVLLGETLQGERSAIVRTSLASTRDGRRLHTTFDTALVREAESWRVDVGATRNALTTALFADSLQQLGEAVGDGAQAFGEALEEGAAQLSEAIREALEELERELQRPPPPAP